MLPISILLVKFNNFVCFIYKSKTKNNNYIINQFFINKFVLNYFNKIKYLLLPL